MKQIHIAVMLNLYLGSAQFKSWLEHQVYQLGLQFYSVCPCKCTIPWSDPDQFALNFVQFISHATINTTV